MECENELLCKKWEVREKLRNYVGLSSQYKYTYYLLVE